MNPSSTGFCMHAWHKMELKVWVEGIQRVICGVTEATTCQDVVIALAHATGKTGRFTLVERWRDNERLLAPSEAPLRVLHKWGEYASDVQFILRRSDKDRRKNGDWSSKRTEKFLHNFTPHGQQRRSSASSIKKSLTFSGAHSFFPPVKSPPKQIAQDNSSLESLDDRLSSASFSSKSSTSPYASLDKQRRHYHGGMPPHGASPYGSLEKQYNKSGQTLRPSPHHSPRTSTSSGGSPPNTIERGRLKTSPLAQRVQPVTPTKDKLDPSSVSTNNNSIIKSANVPEGYSIDKVGQHKGDHGGQKGPAVSKPDRIIGQENDFTKLNGTLPETGLAEELKDNPSANKEDLMKLVRLQQERLSVQDSQLKIVDSEMQYWETREQDFEKQYKAVKEETDRLQQTEKSLFESLQELDLVSWVDKLEIERQQEKMILSEITLVRSQLANAESELLAAKNKIHQLNEEAEEARRVKGKREQEAKENEIKVLHEISELQKQMNRKLLQHEQNAVSLDEVLAEVKKLESAILEKKTQIADYDKELRELNFNNFTKAPSTDWLSPAGADLGASEKIIGRLSPSRPGSSRKMTHNPQLLKETVATTRNPHGMWV